MMPNRKNIQDNTSPNTQDWINYILANREEFEEALKLAEPVVFVNTLIMIAMYLSPKE